MRTSILAVAPRRHTVLAQPLPFLFVLLLVLVLALVTPSVSASGSAPWGASSVRTVPVVGGGKLPYGVWVGRMVRLPSFRIYYRLRTQRE